MTQEGTLHYWVQQHGIHAAEAIDQILDEDPHLMDQCDQFGFAPLHYTVLAGDLSNFKQLLRRGANYNIISNREGYSALHLIATGGYDSMLMYLLQHCKDKIPRLDLIIQERTFGWTPLHGACDQGHLYIVQKLVEARVDINIQDFDGRTPLHLVLDRRSDPVLAFWLALKDAKVIETKTEIREAPKWDSIFFNQESVLLSDINFVPTKRQMNDDLCLRFVHPDHPDDSTEEFWVPQKRLIDLLQLKHKPGRIELHQVLFDEEDSVTVERDGITVMEIGNKVITSSEALQGILEWIFTKYLSEDLCKIDILLSIWQSAHRLTMEDLTHYCQKQIMLALKKRLERQNQQSYASQACLTQSMFGGSGEYEKWKGQSLADYLNALYFRVRAEGGGDRSIEGIVASCILHNLKECVTKYKGEGREFVAQLFESVERVLEPKTPRPAAVGGATPARLSEEEIRKKRREYNLERARKILQEKNYAAKKEVNKKPPAKAANLMQDKIALFENKGKENQPQKLPTPAGRGRGVGRGNGNRPVSEGGKTPLKESLKVRMQVMEKGRQVVVKKLQEVEATMERLQREADQELPSPRQPRPTSSPSSATPPRKPSQDLPKPSGLNSPLASPVHKRPVGGTPPSGKDKVSALKAKIDFKPAMLAPVPAAGGRPVPRNKSPQAPGKLEALTKDRVQGPKARRRPTRKPRTGGARLTPAEQLEDAQDLKEKLVEDAMVFEADSILSASRIHEEEEEDKNENEKLFEKPLVYSVESLPQSGSMIERQKQQEAAKPQPSQIEDDFVMIGEEKKSENRGEERTQAISAMKQELVMKSTEIKPSGEWACSRCTLLNPNDRNICDACDHHRESTSPVSNPLTTSPATGTKVACWFGSWCTQRNDPQHAAKFSHGEGTTPISPFTPTPVSTPTPVTTPATPTPTPTPTPITPVLQTKEVASGNGSVSTPSAERREEEEADYESEVTILKEMGFAVTEEKAVELLRKSNGNIEEVIHALLL